MSTSGLSQTYQPNTLDGLNVLEADQIYIDGQLVNLSDYVPYQSATKTIDLNSQIIKTSHTATTSNELVNKGLLDTSISNLAISIAGSFLDKVTTTPQTVIGNVSYTAQLSSDNLIVPETKEADLSGVVQVSGNYRRTESDAGVTATSSFGSITNSLGVYQATSTANFATLGLATVTVGKRYKININVLGDIASYTSSLQLYASTDGINPTQSLGVSAGFLPSSTIFQLLTTSFVPQYQYIILLCVNSSPTGAGLTVKWFGLELYETGVELEKVTLPLLTASKVPILNSRRQLVASGTDSSKLQWLDNSSEDIQTALNNRLKLDGSNANQNIVLGSYKVQSTATPTVNSDYTTKIYVDNEIIGAGSLYLLKTGGTMTGDIVMGANKITSTATPTTDDTLTRKGYVDTQLALKANLVGPNTFSNTHTFTSPVPITLSGLTASRVLQLNGSGNVESSTVTTTTLGFLDATSSVQNQLNAKANLTGGNTFSGNQVFNSGSISISSRLLGEPDGSPSGNFWIGLRGTGTEIDRLAIGINGNQTTGAVGFVSISKTLNLGSVTANRVLILDASNNVGASTVTPATLAFLDATSSVQTQLNARVAKAGDTMTGQLSMSGTTQIEFGLGLSKEVNSGKIGYGWVTGSGLEIVGGGTTAGQRAVIAYDRLGVGVLPVVPFQVAGVASISGNVGIGTTNPQSVIHINTSGTHQIRLQTSHVDNHFITGANDLMALNANLSLSTIPNVGRGSCQIILQTPTAGGFIQFMTGNAVNTVPSERMRITGAGSVGIGTTDPATAVHIARSFSTNGDYAGMITFENTLSGYYEWQIGPQVIGGSALFSIRGGADGLGSLSNMFNVLPVSSSVGYVGINVTNPRAPLEVSGDIITAWTNSRIGTQFNTTSSGYYLGMITNVSTRELFLDAQSADIGGSGAIILRTGSGPTERLRVDKDGQTASGVTGNTLYNLKFANSLNHISGTASEALLFAGYNGHIAIGRNATRNATTANLMMGVESTEESQIISVKTDNSGYMPLTFASSRYHFASGYVGIGVPSGGGFVEPLARFTINSTYGVGGENSGLCINATDGTVYNLRLYPYVQAGGQVAYQFRVSNGGSVSNAMALGYNGYVGIGTTQPSAPLTVNGSITIKSGGTYEAGCIYSDANWGMLMRGAVAPNIAHFRWDTSAGNELMRINTSGALTTSGAVGVNTGTTVPTGVLDVYSTIADYTNTVVVRSPWASVVLDNSALTTSGRKWSILSGGTGAGVGAGNFGIFDITASAYRLAINSSGDIGMGTVQLPTSTLDINRSPARTGTHGSDLGLYVTNGGNRIAEFRDPNGTQGIGLGYNRIYATGTNTNQDISIEPKGTGSVFIGAQYQSRGNGSPFWGQVFLRDPVDARVVVGQLEYYHSGDGSNYFQGDWRGMNRTSQFYKHVAQSGQMCWGYATGYRPSANGAGMINITVRVYNQTTGQFSYNTAYRFTNVADNHTIIAINLNYGALPAGWYDVYTYTDTATVCDGNDFLSLTWMNLPSGIQSA